VFILKVVRRFIFQAAGAAGIAGKTICTTREARASD
jgi:hypothetical protein